MTVNLYKWTTPDQINQVKQYMTSCTPSSSHILGYLMNTGFYIHDGPDECTIWSSHPDPFNTSDIVVWFLEGSDRVRFFVSAETRLDVAEFTQEAFEQAFRTDKSSGHDDIQYFKEPEEEAFYRKSLKVFEDHYVYFMNQKKRDERGILFHHISLLWVPVMYKHSAIDFDGPCYTFIKKASDPLDKVQLPEHLEFASLDAEKDTAIVREKNKVTYEYEYVKDCIRLSTAIRTKDTGDLAAWTMTHRDFTVGALHVLPEHRRQRLAEAVLTDISRVYIDHYQRQLPGVPLSQLYFNSCVESYNKPSYNLFKKCGWSLLGLGCTWVHCT